MKVKISRVLSCAKRSLVLMAINLKIAHLLCIWQLCV